MKLSWFNPALKFCSAHASVLIIFRKKRRKNNTHPNHSLSWIAIFSSEHRLKLWTPVELSTLTSTCKEILRWNNTPHSRLMDCSRTVAKGWERNASKISSVCFCKWNANEQSFNETIGGKDWKLKTPKVQKKERLLSTFLIKHLSKWGSWLVKKTIQVSEKRRNEGIWVSEMHKGNHKLW